MGSNPKHISLALYKFIGAILRGLNQNIARNPNQYRRVNIIGSTVVNLRLEKTLQKLGFIDIKKSTTPSDQNSIERKLNNKFSSRIGKVSVKTATAASIYGKYKKGLNGLGPMYMIPIMTTSMKTIIATVNYVSHRGKGKGISWVLELELLNSNPGNKDQKTKEQSLIITPNPSTH